MTTATKLPTVRVQIPRGLHGLTSGHALLEASAGTGKTYTIEHIVVDLVLQGAVTIEQILVVTFTRKAAAEMAGRIRDRLVAIADATQDTAAPGDVHAWVIDAQARQRLRQAVLAFDQAPISTIHAFCKRVLDEQQILCGHIPDDGRASLRALFHDAWTATFRQILHAPSARRELLLTFLGTGDGVDTLEDWLWRAHLHTDTIRPLHRPEALGPARDTLRAVVQAAPTANLVASLRGDGVHHRSAESVPNDVAALKALFETHDHLDTAAFQVHFLACAEPIMDKGAVHKRDEYRGWARSFFDAVAALVEAMPSKVALAIHAFLPDVNDLFHVARRRHGALDDDLLLRDARDALQGPGSALLLERLRARYRVALVDEFQDTDDVQWDIFRTLFVETGATGRFIAVGDPKQAIYMFRGGDVNTYLAARRQLGDAPRVLSESFRSTPAMVEATNRILLALHDGSPLLGDGDVQYTNPVTAARAGPGVFARKPDGTMSAAALPPLHVLRFEDPGLSSDVARDQLRTTMAAEIARLVLGGAAVHEEGRHRELKASDVMCLTLTNEEASVMVEELRRFGVPAAQYRAPGLWFSAEARDLHQLLLGLADPTDRSARLRALHTAFFGFSLDELERVDALSPTDERLVAWRRAVRCAEERRWSDLCITLRQDTGMSRRLSVSPEGERALLALGFLLDQVKSMARDGCPDVATLARRVGARCEGDEETDASSDDEDHFPSSSSVPTVRVLTLHKAKGLEAHVVALAFGIGVRGGRSSVFFPMHEADGRRVVWAGKKGMIRSVKEQIDREQDLEDRRLQYVALTRARSLMLLPLLLVDGSGRRDGLRLHPLHAHANARIRHLVPTPDFAPFVRTHTVTDGARPASGPANPNPAPALPPPTVDQLSTGATREARELRPRARGLVTESFTRLQDLIASDTPAPPSAEVGSDDVPRGTAAGILMHALLEQMPLASGEPPKDFPTWRAREDVGLVFSRFWKTSRWTEPQRQQAEHLVFRALHTPLALPGAAGPRALGTLPLQREVRFVFPFPTDATALGAQVRGRFVLEHGVMTGAMDFVFSHDKRLFLGDWKSNSLEDYAPETVQQSVVAKYTGQVRIYTLALMRMARIHSAMQYDDTIGGAVYVYLRGLDADGRGVCVARPSFAEMAELDRALRDRARSSVASGPEAATDEITRADEDDVVLEEKAADEAFDEGPSGPLFSYGGEDEGHENDGAVDMSHTVVPEDVLPEGPSQGEDRSGEAE